MSGRPTRVPLWAYGDTPNAIVEPPLSLAEVGWDVEERPPAPYFNALQHLAGAWINFLRGPNLSNWRRMAYTALDGSGPVRVAVDTATEEASGGSFRYAVAGTESSGPTARLRVAKRPDGEWTARTSSFGAAAGDLSGVAFGCSRWWVWFNESATSGAILSTNPDATGVTDSAIASNANPWDAQTLPGATQGIIALACHPTLTHVAAITFAGLVVYSTDADQVAATWSNYSVSGSISGAGRDLIWTGSAWLAVTSDGEVINATAVNATWAEKSPLAPGAAAWRLAAGANDGEAVAWIENTGSATDLYFTDDNGETWTAITPASSAFLKLKALRFAEGVWIAATAESPWLWQSNDLETWVRLPLPVTNTENPSISDALFAEGVWMAPGPNAVWISGRSIDPYPGSFVPNTDPPFLADAGSLRGYVISTTAPTTGQVLTYDGTDLVWSAAGAAATLTTDGDLLTRDSGALARLPVGTDGQALAVVGGAPTWVDAEVLTGLGLDAGLTTNGDLLTKIAGAVDRLPIGTNGQVLTVVSGLPAWAASAGATHGSGTLAARPASPAAGDTYRVTSGAALNDRYVCFVAGTWTLVGYDRIREDETPYLWWRLTEASGNAASSGSAGSATLTASSISAYNAALPSLPIRGMVFASGSSSNLAGATGATGLTTAWTLAAWVRYGDTSLNYRTVVALDNVSGSFGQPYASAALAVNNAGGVRAWLTTTSQTGSGQSVSSSGTLAVDGAPHHLVARFDGTNLQVVIDGVQRATTTTTGNTTHIGASPRWTVGMNDANEYWLGTIADVRVYTTAKDDAWCLETWARGVGAYGGQ